MDEHIREQALWRSGHLIVGLEIGLRKLHEGNCGISKSKARQTGVPEKKKACFGFPKHA